jgi:poly-beta-1,6-N-acetyl-D-glucosamine synthase
LSASLAFTPIQMLCCVTFAAASAVVVYVLFGYPLLLRRMADRWENPVRKDDHLRTVSIVVCVRNGEKFIERKLRAILDLNYPRELMEILVVSDGSQDRTDEIARTFESKGVRLLTVPHGGKAAALNVAVPLVSGEILVLSDIRQSLHPDCLRELVACFGDPKVGAVSATVVVPQEDRQQVKYDSGLYLNYESYIRRQMSRIDSTFGTHGPFYAMRRSLWTKLPAGTILDDVYVPLSAFFKGYRVVIEPSAIFYELPNELSSEFHRKVRLQAGLYQLLKLMPELLSSKNRMRVHFLSAKYGRMIVPYCLIGIALSTLGLPGVLQVPAIAFQVVFYGAAALDSMVPAGFPIKRITSAVRAFVVLMWASLVGLKVFFVPPERIWRETSWRLTAGVPPPRK